MSRQKKFHIWLIANFLLIFAIIVGGEIVAFSHLSGIQGSAAENKYRSGKIAEKVENLESLKTRYADIENDIPKINTALPDEKESSQLLSDLNNLAEESGLKLTLVQASTYGQKNKSKDLSLLQTTKGKYGLELPLEVKVSGPYPNFVNFVTQLENYQRLLSVGSIDIVKNEERGASPDAINAQLKMVAYLKK